MTGNIETSSQRRSWQDLVEELQRSRLGYPPAYAQKLVGRARVFATTIFRQPLPDIEASLAAFDRNCAPYRHASAIPKPFLTPQSFRAARSELRGALRRFDNCGASESVPVTDDWTRLEQEMRPALEIDPLVIAEQAWFSLRLFATKWRSRGVTPRQLSVALVRLAYQDTFTEAERKYFKRAVKMIVLARCLRPEIGHLVSDLAPALPLHYRKATSRNVVRPPQLVQSREDWLARNALVPGTDRRSGRALKPRTIQAYRRGTNWYIDCAVAMGLATDACSPRDIADADQIELAVIRELDGEFEWGRPCAATVLKNLQATTFWLSTINPDLRGLAPELVRKHRVLQTTGRMGARHQVGVANSSPIQAHRNPSLTSPCSCRPRPPGSFLDTVARRPMERPLRSICRSPRPCLRS